MSIEKDKQELYNKRHSQLVFRIRMILDKKRGTFFLKNPYQEQDILDLVEYIGFLEVPELYPFRHIFVKTKNKERMKYGVQAEYFWYDSRITIATTAALILHHILQNNGNNIRIKTKLSKYVEEALEDLKINEEEANKLIKDIITKKEDIARMSN